MWTKYTYNKQKSIENEFAIFQENEQLGFSFKQIFKLWTRKNKSPASVFVDIFCIPIAAWSSVCIPEKKLSSELRPQRHLIAFLLIYVFYETAE